MDCRGRWVDNVQVERLWRSRKYHEIYLKAYLTVAEARFGIGSYFRLYNCAPWQRLLDGQTSGQIYGGRVMWPVAA
jgi:putative transposase